MINEISFLGKLPKGLMPNVMVWAINDHLLIICAKGIHGTLMVW
jgi:hypothetical protein